MKSLKKKKKKKEKKKKKKRNSDGFRPTLHQKYWWLFETAGKR
jgi:hypothetical protein